MAQDPISVLLAWPRDASPEFADETRKRGAIALALEARVFDGMDLTLGDFLGPHRIYGRTRK